MNQSGKKSKIIELYSLLFTDYLCIILSFIGAIFIRHGGMISEENRELYYTVVVCFLLFCTCYNLLVDRSKDFLRRGNYVEIVAIIKYEILMTMIVGCFLFLIKQAEEFSRLSFGYFAIINLVMTFVGHIGIKKLLRNYLQSEHSKIRIMVITELALYEDVLAQLNCSMDFGYEITSIAILDMGKRDAVMLENENIQVILREELNDVAKTIPLDEVFVCTQKENSEYVTQILQDFENMGVVCHYKVNTTKWNGREGHIDKFGGFTVLSYSVNRIDYRKYLIKRMMDIVGSCIGLLIMGICYPFVAMAIKGTSKGPVLFTQIRIGKNGRRFKMYKFRSMNVNAEQQKKGLQKQNEMVGLMFKMNNDPRVTKVGKFLRKTSVDELPQFINVLKGDMSLIGTRPPTEDEFEKYSIYYRRRLCITPGMTGMWQVSGRSSVQNFDDVVEYDLEYIDNWTLGLDLKILLMTVGVVLTGKGSK